MLGARSAGAAREFREDRLGFTVGEGFERRAVIDAGGVELLFDATGEVPVAAGVEIQIKLPKAQFRKWVARLDAADVPLVRPGRDHGGPLGEEAAFKEPSGCVGAVYAGSR